MKLTQVDDRGRLYAIEDFYPDELFARLLELEWNTQPWAREDQQEMWARKSLLKYDIPVLKEASDYVASLTTWFESTFGIKFEFDANAGNTNWWVDQPGFWVPMHTDGELPFSMQIFIKGQPNLGTEFYKHNSEQYLIRKFDFKPNTGYVMLNHKNDDGSQPLQWHAMLTHVPEGEYRVCSYTVFPPYSHK
jgi:hypothetical protein